MLLSFEILQQILLEMDHEHKKQLLQAEAAEDDESFFRLQVDGAIKHLTVEQGVYSVEDMCFAPSLFSILPSFPPGDWNDGLVSKDASGQPFFARATRTQFPSVENKWHNIFIDYSDLSIGKKVRTGVYEVTSPHIKGTVIAKFARFEWEITYLENETTAYQWIEGHNIGPRFLGHLTEGDRVIGFLMERIVNARNAGPGDLDTCQRELSKLHQLGLRHGDVNRINFLVQGSRAVLLDFDTARKCDDQDRLCQELEALPEALGSASTRGGGGLTCVDTN